MISIIAIIGKNRELGCENKLLWSIPEDMDRFKTLTTGHPVIMGRKTFESIGHALPGRTNIVITKQNNYIASGCQVVDSMDEAIREAKISDGSDEIFIIGGAQIYEIGLDFANKLYLSIVDDAPVADVYFPDYSRYNKIIKEEGIENDKYKIKFLEITR
ncbi:diacylglycerol kinase [Candidatus Parcubacteria bacterium]|nr:MAG: diacylglycerol kinase [Candidatus Parcubacteria bacterium]